MASHSATTASSLTSAAANLGATEANATTTPRAPKRTKLHGRAFYESIGSPKYIVAPMVDQSEFAWRMLTRSFLPADEQHKLLCYTPMFHARLFTEAPKYRDSHFQPIRGPLTADSPRPDSSDYVPFLDGNPEFDRSLFVQFCANDPAYLLSAAKLVAPYCDAVDLNLGCPQGIAKRGQYGSFLQENQELIFELINTLHKELDIPVTAKIRILDTKEATLKYAQNVLRAGASILTVHGRRREQKGHQTGLADWEYIRYLRENLPKETVIFANGNILQHADLEKCLAATGADGVMSAEGNLSDPGLFARPPAVGEEGREYWRSKDGSRGGWRVDAVLRRYLDIIYKYVLEQQPPVRRPLFMPGDDVAWLEEASSTSFETTQANDDSEGPARKKHKSANGSASTTTTTTAASSSSLNTTSNSNNPHLDKKALQTSPNLVSMQPHCFHLLRHFVTHHTDVRDLLARARNGSEIGKYEAILSQVERKVALGLLEYERTGGSSFDVDVLETLYQETEDSKDDPESSAQARRENKRPWWVVQPIIRPLPKEALAKGALQLSKKELKAQAAKKAAGGGGGGDAEATVASNLGSKEKEEKKTASEEALVPVQGQNGGETAVESLETTTNYPKSELVSG
ncbi:Dus-domain-containing protein [Neurospora crassa]|uniref:tRNA-dihydrouridine(16/17) synthase [NAD(P)(+)] n=1 Tax=Neurospora crassa (strain ATCC 24698 / 74-OR23-1A / CBS 708.71 / DSM 1257 / FGSC 987) TaxID=367110 RepID=Q7RX85_NEUCR|nr:tRNA-dihydrouridine synthase 1 [Neurospora crassa OR74A]EAA27139.3 tRNA-dihydrouridine synthase 1 [Neurospora crassa OR74A]KHE79643.1 Dus-domain-containing protein [Neurospora crassa]|eukprot:XP_956375.3 tRNA-dihydrouridine synthase 1 [Neurospora crassa OR74A]